MRHLTQSTFISYGNPDAEFAQRPFEALRSYGGIVFYLPENVLLGERIDGEIFRQLQRHDRMIKICSKASFDRPGVLHELRETLDCEARDGGQPTSYR